MTTTTTTHPRQDIDHTAECALLSVNELCVSGGCSLVLSFSAAETARYLELLRLCDSRSARTIRTRLDDQYAPRLQDVLTAVRSVNKTDVLTLAGRFGSVRGIMQATQRQMAACPGFGRAGKKARRLWDTVHADWST